MNVITIPKKLTKGEELIILPRKEYEEFFQWRKTVNSYKFFTPTLSQKRILKKAREDYRRGNYLTIDELKQKLALKN